MLDLANLTDTEAAAVAAVIVTATLLAARWTRGGTEHRPGLGLTAAAGLTALWCCLRLVERNGLLPSTPVRLVDLARGAGWVFLAWRLGRHGSTESNTAGDLLAVVAICAAVVAALGMLGTTAAVGNIGCVLLAATGLVLVTAAAWRPDPKTMRAANRRGLTIGVVLLLDLAAALTGIFWPRAGAPIDLVRAPIDACAVAFLAFTALRHPAWSGNRNVMPARARDSLLLLAIAAPVLGLLVAIAQLVGRTGSRGGSLAQAALSLGVVGVVASGLGAAGLGGGPRGLASRFRFLRRLERYRYDYREQWLCFVDTLSSDERADIDPLPDRVVDAVAEVVAARGGALWLYGEERMHLATHRGLILPVDPPLQPEAIGVVLSGASDGVLDLGGSEVTGQLGAVVAGWRAIPRAWLLLPLVHRRRFVGLLLLAEPRRPHALDWEDRRLLRTLGRAAASYLVEDVASRALQEAREFEAFNRRFAFVAHDLKHVSARLNLALSNARRYRGNLEFYDDLLEMLEDTAARADRLVREMRDERPPAVGVDLALLVEGVVASREERRPDLGPMAPDLKIQADAARLATALDHLIDNGFDASGAEGTVQVAVRAQGGMAVVAVRDNGSGMAPDYMANGFGKPFVSTKPDGLGLGLYEVRHIVEVMGGRLEVESQPGSGTVISLYLPTLGPSGGGDAGDSVAPGVDHPRHDPGERP